MKLSEYLDQKITPEGPWRGRKPQKVEIKKIQDINWAARKAPAKFEQEVFAFLLQNQRQLGIQKIFRLKNSGIDGLLVLDDDCSVALEIKYRMNWEKACQANRQFEGFLLRISIFAKEYQPKMGVVFFHDFSADWRRKPLIREIENGWLYWYSGHCELTGLNFKMHLLRLSDGKLYGYPSMNDSDEICPSSD